MNSISPSVPLAKPAVPRVERRQVHEEDADRRGLRVAGQDGLAEASGGLAQAARQHRSDPLIGETLLVLVQ